MFIEVNTRASKQLALTDLILFFITSCSVKWNYWRFFFLLQTRIKNCSRLKLAILQNHLTANLFSIYMQLLQCSIWAKQKPLWRKYICIGVRKPLSWTLSFFLFFERNLIFILKNHVTIYLVFFLRITR